MPRYAANLDDVRTAAQRIKGQIHRTPVLTCTMLDRMAGRQLYLKCENLQKVGAFKFRGASNAIARLAEDVAQRGVVTHSSGNHAQALALAARLRGIPAHVVMPNTAPDVKRRAVQGYGARIIACEPTLEARETTAKQVLEETGGTFIPPYDHPDVIAGQGTVALELLEEVPDLEAIIAPVGGGGLVSGIAVAVQQLAPGVRVFAAEPIGADDAARSKKANQLIPQSAPKTIADGLLTSLGELTWPIVRDLVEEVVTVTDEEIIEAMQLVWERVKIIIEPSAAVAVAAVLSKQFRQRGGLGRIGVILSGGNVDLTRLPW